MTAGGRQVRPIELEWEKQTDGDNYQVLWDFGWGGVNFWPAQDVTQTEMIASDVNKYNHNVLDEKWTIQYRVRACNTCGCTDSEVLVIQCQEATNKPGVMQPVTSTLGAECDVRFTWFPPSVDGGEPVTGYKIDVQGANGQYNTMQACSQVTLRDVMSCTVNMSDLSSAPFYLKSGDPIMVSGRAMNANGWCPDRSVAQGGVRMMTTGLDAPHLRIEGVPRDRINLAWTDIPSASKYEVEWDAGKEWDSTTPMVWTTYRKSIDLLPQIGSDYTQLPTMSIDFENPLHNAFTNSQNFRFRVRAIGGCGGDNPYSNILHVCLTDDPPIMPTVTTETVGCAVRINIGSAISGGQADAIKIQIQGSDYQYYTDNLPCSTAGGAVECVVHQDILKSHPYNLRPGHLVIVRVAGKNAAGWGAFSGPNTVGAPIASIPYQLGAPVADDKTKDSISLSWPRYYSSGIDHTFDHDYELEFCPPRPNGLECVWENLVYTSGTTYVHTGL